MFHYEKCVTADVDPAAIWAVWSDIDSWGEWIPHMQQAHLDGALQEGVTGQLVTGGRTVVFTVVELHTGTLFTNESRLPLARLRAHHEVRTNADDSSSCEVINRVTITGPLSWLFGRIVGKGIDAEHTAMLEALIARART